MVEDDPDVRQSIVDAIEDQGFHITVAGNGLEATAILEQGVEPCAVILDLMMPVMSGDQFFARLPPDLQRRVVLMTAGQHVASGLSGAFTLLRKPFHVEDLRRAVNALCSQQVSH